jgi:lysophospholipid acyltransferase (LPLAT)-like uncharacterized protein
MAAGSKFRNFLIDICGRPLLRLWAKSCRMSVVGEEEHRALRREGKPCIIIVWHGRILLPPFYFRKRNIMPLISPSGDGEIVARIVEGWGYKVLRGSSSHSMVGAWKDMIRELRSGGELIIVPDGPRGPNRVLKEGCLRLAQETGAWIVPFSFSASRKKSLDSWDRFLIFKPFSRLVVLFGKPFAVAPDLAGETFEAERLRVEGFLTGLDEEADRFFGGPAT